MKKLIILTLIIVGTLGVSSYSNGKTANESNKADKQTAVTAETNNDADTITFTRIGRSNLAQAD